MNTAVAITALFSGIFIVFIGGLADRIGRVKIVMAGFVLSIIGSLLIGFAPGWSGCVIFPAARPSAAGPVGRLHHAGEPGFG